MTPLMAESEEELKSLLMKVKEESEKAHSFMCFLAICMSIWQRRQWHHTPVLLPGKSHGWRSLVLQSLGLLRVGYD